MSWHANKKGVSLANAMPQLKITNVMTLNLLPPNVTMNDTKISQNSLDKPPLTLMQCPVQSLQVPVVDNLIEDPS